VETGAAEQAVGESAGERDGVGGHPSRDPELRRSLQRITVGSGGALEIVSGRPQAGLSARCRCLYVRGQAGDEHLLRCGLLPRCHNRPKGFA